MKYKMIELIKHAINAIKRSCFESYDEDRAEQQGSSDDLQNSAASAAFGNPELATIKPHASFSAGVAAMQLLWSEASDVQNDSTYFNVSERVSRDPGHTKVFFSRSVRDLKYIKQDLRHSGGVGARLHIASDANTLSAQP